MYQGGCCALRRDVPVIDIPARRVESRAVDVGLLLRRVIEGDQRAWDELVGRFGGLVWSIARGYRLGASTDDVVQTVWLRLAEHCDRIREPDRLAAWLAATTRNEALRVATRERRSVAVADVPDHGDSSRTSIEETVTDGDTIGHVLRGFALLPDKDRELLRLLCTVPPLDYATIAEILDRPIGSIGPSRERALAKLRKLLPSGLDEPAPRTPPPTASRTAPHPPPHPARKEPPHDR
jgi:RNA polymerase sigma factor (sigma-70 family)